MEKKLFNRLKESMLSFNTNPLLDIPTGGYVATEAKPRASWDMRGMAPRNMSMWMLTKLQSVLESHAPGTFGRWYSAAQMLTYMGYTVKWDDETKCPQVFWVNTEGNAEQEAQMIQDIMHRDYEENPRLTVPSEFDGKQTLELMKHAMNGTLTPTIIDSISDLKSTVQS